MLVKGIRRITILGKVRHPWAQILQTSDTLRRRRFLHPGRDFRNEVQCQMRGKTSQTIAEEYNECARILRNKSGYIVGGCQLTFER